MDAASRTTDCGTYDAQLRHYTFVRGDTADARVAGRDPYVKGQAIVA